MLYNVYKIFANDYANTSIVLRSYYNEFYVLGGLPLQGVRLRNPLGDSVDHMVRQRSFALV